MVREGGVELCCLMTEGLRARHEIVLSQGFGTGVKMVHTDRIHPKDSMRHEYL